MRIHRHNMLFFCLATFASTLQAEDAAKSPFSPLYGMEGKVLLQADFTSTSLDEAWKTLKGKWSVKDGVLSGVEVPDEKHAAVLRHDLPVHDFIATFVFRFDSGKAIKLVLNKDTTHVCQAAMTPSELTVYKHPEKNKTPAQKTGTLDAQKIKPKPDEWHTAIVEVIGNTIVASVDGHDVVWGSHDGIDMDKTSFDLAANASATLKSAKFCQATPPADLEAAKQKLQALRPKPAAAMER